jgi:hypothetical protein
MKIVCAWCGKHLGKKEPTENKHVTHTICKKCREKELNKFEISIGMNVEQEYIRKS